VSGAIYRVLRPALFRLDPERAHALAILAARAAEPIARTMDRSERSAGGGSGDRLGQSLLGLWFPRPVGLAAGFDKDAVAPHLWPLCGFGFAELGTVTGEPQSGNPRPRVFRLEPERAVVNRLGFNSAGAGAVAARLVRLLSRRPSIPIGINIGCSRIAIGDSTRALADYCTSARLLAPLADYLAINVSSPNTPGLRDLQDPGRLADLIRAIRDAIGTPSGKRRVPLLVKLAPDLETTVLSEVAGAALEAGCEGFIAGNTTLGRPNCTSPAAGEAGGLSGGPLRAHATSLVRRLRAAIPRSVPIIGVGGVTTLADVIEKLEAGADLVALYTALVYEGPLLAWHLSRALERELERRGLDSIGSLAATARS